MESLRLDNISIDRFNPFGASPEELLANALYDAGLLNEQTSINGEPAETYLQVFFMKRSAFRDATLLGKMLIDSGEIPYERLRDALKYQKEHKGLKIGEVLIKLNLCGANEVDQCLKLQQEKRNPR